MFKIKDGYKIELHTLETMKVFRSAKKLIGKTKNKENVPFLVVLEGLLTQCNLVDNQHQQKSETLYNFTPYKYYGYLCNVEANALVFLKTYNTDFDDIIITFATQNGKPLKIEYKVNLTLLINK